MASCPVLSCSAPASMTVHLPACLARVLLLAACSRESPASPSRDTLFSCTLLSKLHSISLTTLTSNPPKYRVWRFLITFADVLKLWPFTLDEFVQAFHDYDSRMLGEIHVALLKLIIKDIEDVARAPSTGLVVNQNSAANPGGGHPQIVKGAYAWGFDIRNWQRHLNPLTWPEIFWQLALFAGFGPQLKKRSIRWSYSHENDEVTAFLYSAFGIYTLMHCIKLLFCISSIL
uniref:DDT domain-containing protein n=1 Tax=Quercus lobata TaxID=97700 RepID=A0A7N2LIG8_QUELO